MYETYLCCYFILKISMSVNVIPLVSIMGRVLTTMVPTLAIARKVGKVFTVRKVMKYYHFQFSIVVFEMFYPIVFNGKFQF